MSPASEPVSPALDELARLLEARAAVFARPELRTSGPAVRLRLRTRGRRGPRGAGWLLTWPGAGGKGPPALRPWRLADGPPDLEVSARAEDLLRHLHGEVELLGSRRPLVSYRQFDERHPVGDLVSVVHRALDLLALDTQDDERFRGGTAEELYLTHRSRREDGGYEPMGSWSLPFHSGRLLYELVRDEGLERTLEVGMAHGLSTIFIAQAHRDRNASGGATGRHLAIDPWQARGFGRAGTENVRRAGLLELVEVLEEEDWSALPRLAQESPAGFQLAFIDGLHVFDYALLDLFYCDLLLAEGGYLVFDDACMQAVGSVIDYLETNRGESYERVEALSGDRLAVYRKTAPDTRIERHGVTFHRRFRGDGPAYPSFPAPAGNRLLKRAFDLAVGIPLALLALVPALLMVAAIALQDLRAGHGVRSPLVRIPLVSRGRRFDLLRFRTLERADEPTGPGRLVLGLLTRLPQLWNLVSGDLSLVGPTPIRPEENVRRQLFRTTGLRAGLVGPQDLNDGAGDAYYHDWAGRGGPSLLVHDVLMLVRALPAKLRSVAAGSRQQPA